MKKITLLTATLMITIFSQAQFLVKGKIEFERKINIHRQIDDESEGNSWAETMKKTLPQYKMDYFDYVFEADKAIYKPGRENESFDKRVWENPAAQNVIFTDYANKTFSAQKAVFEQTYLVKDSLRNIQWKITPDTRKIAGFDCRKATAIIMDSIYVVAFYTDEIMVSGGPESFSGLPGMILGLAMPRLNCTWFATKVQLEGIKPNEIASPTKGKKATNAELKSTLDRSLKDWGKYANRYVWWIMI